MSCICCGLWLYLCRDLRLCSHTFAWRLLRCSEWTRFCQLRTIVDETLELAWRLSQRLHWSLRGDWDRTNVITSVKIAASCEVWSYYHFEGCVELLPAWRLRCVLQSAMEVNPWFCCVEELTWSWSTGCLQYCVKTDIVGIESCFLENPWAGLQYAVCCSWIPIKDYWLSFMLLKTALII